MKKAFVACLVLFLGVAFVSASVACDANNKPIGIYGGHSGSPRNAGHGFAGTEGRSIKRGFIVEGQNPFSNLGVDVTLAKTYSDTAVGADRGVLSRESRFVPSKTFPLDLSPVLNI